jgi:replicative DNA helicase
MRSPFESGESVPALPGGSPDAQTAAPLARNETDPWPVLIPVGQPDPPPFPVNALPAELREYVQAVAAQTQTPVDAAALLGLAVASAASMGKAVAVGYPGHVEELMLYVVIGMASAERKTALLNRMVGPLFDLEKAIRDEQEPSRRRLIAQSDKAKDDLKRLRREAAKQGSTVTDNQIISAMAAADALRVPPDSKLVLTSATPEALVEAMAENSGRISLFSDESSIFGVMAGRYAGNGGSVDLDPFLHGHNGGRIRLARIGRAPSEVEHARLAMGLIVQPSAFHELASARDAEGRGLLARPIYSVPPRIAGTRVYGQQQPIEPLIKLAYAERVKALGRAAIPKEPTEIRCTPEALTLLIEFANRHERRLATDGDLVSIDSWAGKHVGAVLRIAALSALWPLALDEPFAQGRCWIEARHVESAITIGAYLVPHALNALGSLGAPDWTDTATRVINWIKRKNLRDWSQRDCLTALVGSRSRVQSVSDLMRPLDALVERGYIRRCASPESARGRPPSPSYETSPQLFDP